MSTIISCCLLLRARSLHGALLRCCPRSAQHPTLKRDKADLEGGNSPSSQPCFDCFRLFYRGWLEPSPKFNGLASQDYLPPGSTLFNTIAAIEAAKIGEPNRYCTNVGNGCKKSCGIITRAKVMIIGIAMMYSSFSAIFTFFITCTPLMAMMPQRMVKTSPMTAVGIEEIKAAPVYPCSQR